MEDSMSPQKITNGLNTHLIGGRVLHYPSLPSTMEAAREEAARGATEGTVIVANEQTAGHGRLGRAWLSPQGSISVSVVLYPDVADLPYLIMIASLAVARSIEALTGLEALLKWPNDVLVNGRKVAGILIESSMGRKAVDYAVMGIGININVDMSVFPEIAATATSLSGELHSSVSRLRVVRRLLVELDGLYKAPRQAIYGEWRSRLTTLGRQVCVVSGGDAQYGRAESVTADGGLMLRRDDGSLTRVLTGDVSLSDAADDNATR
jgi:BirA family biotin operon repressor/biotin-[acetyl-CoA-carboxylase] ligase